MQVREEDWSALSIQRHINQKYVRASFPPLQVLSKIIVILVVAIVEVIVVVRVIRKKINNNENSKDILIILGLVNLFCQSCWTSKLFFIFIGPKKLQCKSLVNQIVNF